ncbi:hypothetical protein Ancab_033040 [Ancistrocladus abbreviatus]
MAIQLNHLHTSSLTLKLEKQINQQLRLHNHLQSQRTKGPVSVTQVSAALGAGGGSKAKQLIESGSVRAVLPKDAAAAMATNSESHGFRLLDIRPEWEREKARVPGSLHVPLFIKDTDSSLITLLKKLVHFGYIGLWTGQQLTTIDSEFVSQVERVAPDKDALLLVACGEGLSRSMMAVTKLHEAGYRNLGWLAGGFNRARDGEFPVEGTEKLQYATIGGVSYYFLKLLLLLEALGNAR